MPRRFQDLGTEAASEAAAAAFASVVDGWWAAARARVAAVVPPPAAVATHLHSDPAAAAVALAGLLWVLRELAMCVVTRNILKELHAD